MMCSFIKGKGGRRGETKDNLALLGALSVPSATSFSLLAGALPGLSPGEDEVPHLRVWDLVFEWLLGRPVDKSYKCERGGSW